ncbi:MAG: glycoside hydrolase family 65 protein, partial [Lacrimispora sphenoides]
MSLNYRHGLFSRETVFQTKKGSISLQTERFASMEEKHLIALMVTLTPSFDGETEIITGIDGDVWDINGPHYDSIDTGSLNECLYAFGTTHENQDHVAVIEAIGLPEKTDQMVSNGDRKVIRRISIPLKAGGQYRFYKYIAVYTSKDGENYQSEAEKLALKAKEAGYEKLLSDHKNNWEEKWVVSEVSIEGDDEAMEALNYSLYHLHSIAPRHSESLSIAARGLSGQTYKGAVFWDTEMFMLDFFLFTEPQIVKTLLKYRIDTLPGAQKKAESYGFDGAFYPWESQEGGYDACSDYNVTDVFTGRPMRTYFKDKQIHISAAVVYGIMRYTLFTGKRDLMSEGGAEVILECAKFYYSLLIRRIKDERYEIWDVIGPDEYHERVNNNAYTNRMAKYTLDAAVEILKEEMKEANKDSLQKKELLERLQDAAEHLYIPAPDEKSGIIEQFDGYEQLEEVSIAGVKERLLHEKEYWGGAYGVASHTKIIKQADVVTMINLFSEEYDAETRYKNWTYYEPRTEHGSSLSACMYSMLACKCGMADKAYPFFIKSAGADLWDGGKQWAGLIYIGGTHPAA